jgi:hypothetical protein
MFPLSSIYITAATLGGLKVWIELTVEDSPSEKYPEVLNIQLSFNQFAWNK